MVERGVEGWSAIAGEAGGAVAGEGFDGAVGADAADHVGRLVAEDDVAGGVERDAGELGEGDFLSGHAGADLAAGKGIDHHLGVERCGGEDEEEEDGF